MTAKELWDNRDELIKIHGYVGYWKLSRQLSEEEQAVFDRYRAEAAEIAEKKHLEEERARMLAQKEAIDTQIYNEYKNSLPKRYRNVTLDSYVATTEKQKGVKSAASKGLSFLLCGESHIGKTLLGYGVCDLYAKAGKKARLVYANNLFTALKEAIGQGDIRREINYWSRLDYLVIDEFDKTFQTTSEYVYLNQIISQRYDNMLPTMIISNLPSAEARKILGAPICNRIYDDGYIVDLDGECWASTLHEQTKTENKSKVIAV